MSPPFVHIGKVFTASKPFNVFMFELYTGLRWAFRDKIHLNFRMQGRVAFKIPVYLPNQHHLGIRIPLHYVTYVYFTAVVMPGVPSAIYTRFKY